MPEVLAPRFHVRTCARCEAAIGPDDARPVALHTSTYAPLPDGPEWEAVGDWTEPRYLAGGTLCASCLAALHEWLLPARLRA